MSTAISVGVLPSMSIYVVGSTFVYRTPEFHKTFYRASEVLPGSEQRTVPGILLEIGNQGIKRSAQIETPAVPPHHPPASISHHRTAPQCQDGLGPKHLVGIEYVLERHLLHIPESFFTLRFEYLRDAGSGHRLDVGIEIDEFKVGEEHPEFLPDTCLAASHEAGEGYVAVHRLSE